MTSASSASKVTLVCYRLDVPGGLERSAVALVPILSRAFDLDVVVLRGGLAPALREGLAGQSVEHIRGHPIRLLRTWLGHRSGTVVVAGIWAALLWPPMWTPLWRGRRILWEHSLVPSRFDHDRRLRLLRRPIWRVLRGAGTIVCVSAPAAEYVASELATRHPRSLPRVEVIPNLIPEPAPGATSRAHPDADVQLLAMHRLDPLKNTRLLIEAMAHLPPQYRLTCLGDGPERGRLEEQVRALGLEERVSMPGFVEDVGPHLGRSDIVVHPSLSETSCIAAFEAAAADVPVVCLDVGGLSGVVPRQVVGECVPVDAGPSELAAAIVRCRALCGEAEPFETARRVRAEELGSAVVERRWKEVVVRTLLGDRPYDLDDPRH